MKKLVRNLGKIVFEGPVDSKIWKKLYDLVVTKKNFRACRKENCAMMVTYRNSKVKTSKNKKRIQKARLKKRRN